MSITDSITSSLILYEYTEPQPFTTLDIGIGHEVGKVTEYVDSAHYACHYARARVIMGLSTTVISIPRQEGDVDIESWTQSLVIDSRYAHMLTFPRT